jgi:uncharacterized protein (TIGR03118 family)
MRTWVRCLHRLFRVSSSPRRVRRGRPTVEALEDRCVPATGFTQLDLVSDQANTALLTDSNLVDAWGIGLNPAGGNFWVANNVPSVATQYSGAVNGSPFTSSPLVVQIPFGGPSGVVFNGTTDFGLNNGSPAQFLVSQETAWAAGWNPPLQTNGQAVIDTVPTGAVYKGLAIAQNGGVNRLYVTNIHSGAIEVYDTSFHRVTTLAGSFSDPTTTVPLPVNFAPFNIANIGGQLYVTYAKQNANKDGDVAGPGNGFIDVFNPDGTFVKRLVSNGPLNSPWGLAVAPASFGTVGGDLLAGNFGDGRINVFDPSNGNSLGTLNDASGTPIVIDGLWALQFGNGVSAGDSNALFFSAGPAGETHGLFGSLRANGTNPLSGTATAVTGNAGSALPGVLATFADATPGRTAADFNVTITVNGQSSPGTVTLGGSGFLVTGPNTSPGAGTFPVTIVVQEKATGGASLTLTGSATVAGNPLSAVGPANPQISTSEGSFTGPLVSFADANSGAQAGNFTATITWGNNVTNSGTVAKKADGTFTVSGSNPAPELGTFPSSVAVQDNANHSLSIPFTFLVSEPSLSARGLVVSTDSSGVFSNAAVATFTHGSSTEPVTGFTSTIDWGDGSAVSSGTVAFGGDGYVINGSHTYASSGTFHLTVSLTDEGAPLSFTAGASVAAPAPGPPGPTGPTGPSLTAGERFVTQVIQDVLGQAVDAQTLQRFGGELDQGTSAGKVALDLAQSFGKSLHRVLHQLTGGGSTTKRARQLFLHLLDHPATTKADVALVRSVARKLGLPKTEAKALALLLGSSDYLAKIGS